MERNCSGCGKKLINSEPPVKEVLPIAPKKVCYIYEFYCAGCKIRSWVAIEEKKAQTQAGVNKFLLLAKERLFRGKKEKSGLNNHPS
jgi:hypothetical protein